MIRRTPTNPALRNIGINRPRRLSLERLEAKQMLAANAGPAFEIAADLDDDGQIDYVCSAESCPDLDFGAVAPGETRIVFVGIKNVGDTIARKFSEHLTVTGSQAAGIFRASVGSCLGGWLPAGASCGLVVEFQPTVTDPVGTVYGGDPSLVQLNLNAQNATEVTPLSMGMTGTLAEPPEPPTGSANDIYVEDIDFIVNRRGKHKDAWITIDVNRDSNVNGQPDGVDANAAGVLVTVELRDAGGDLVGAYSGTTNSDGFFISERIRGLPSGNYIAEVIDLTHETFDWNNALDFDPDGNGLPDDVLVV